MKDSTFTVSFTPAILSYSVLPQIDFLRGLIRGVAYLKGDSHFREAGDCHLESLHTLQKRQIAEERQEMSNDLGLQPRCAEDFREFPVNVIVGFLELVQEWTDQLSIPGKRLAKVNDVQLAAGFQHAEHFTGSRYFVRCLQVMDHNAGHHAIERRVGVGEFVGESDIELHMRLALP